MELAKTDIRGVEFANVTMEEALLFAEERLDSGMPAAVFTPNSEIVQMCIEDPEFSRVVNSAELIIPDGIGVVKASAILGTPLKEKVAGYDFGLGVFALAAKKGTPVFLFGGKDGSDSETGETVAEQCARVMKEKYPGLNIAGTRHGYYKKEGEENEETLRQINASGAEILYVCLGAPAQEKWIYANRDKLPGVKLFLGLGGSLDGYSGNVKRAPDIFIRLGLEWFYRLLCQPWRIVRMMNLPKFYFGTWLYKLKKKK